MNDTMICPKCKTEYIEKSAAKKRSWFSRQSFEMAVKQPQFQHATAPAYPQRQAQPVQQVQQQMLSPGESVWRTLGVGPDVITPLAFAAAAAGTMALESAVVVANVKWPGWGWTPAHVLFGGTSLLFLFLGRRVIKLDNSFFMMRKRKSEKAQTVPAEQSTPDTWDLEQTIREGKTTIYTKIKANPVRWHAFCREVDKGMNFSGASAKTFKIKHFDKILNECVNTGLVYAHTVGKGKTPELTSRGEFWVKKYATTPPPASLTT